MISTLPTKESTQKKVYDLLQRVNKEEKNFCIIPSDNELCKLENLLHAYSCNELTLEDVRKQVMKILDQPISN